MENRLSEANRVPVIPMLIFSFTSQALPRLETLLNKFAEAIAPLLDSPSPDINKFYTSGLKGKVKELSSVKPLVKTGKGFNFL